MLAAQTIGIHDHVQQRALVFQQAQMIRELLLIQEHIGQLEAQIEQVVATSREGRILTSLPGIGPQTAATLIAAIGNILIFPDAAALKAYLCWSPDLMQTGTTVDRASLSPAGTRVRRALLYLAAMNVHRAHVAGAYVPAKVRPTPARITRLPQRSEGS